MIAVIRRLALCSASLVLSAGCLDGTPEHLDPAPQPRFDPFAFFAGHTHGEGTLDQRVGKTRHFTVEGMGAMEGDSVFVLSQAVTYADGGTEQRRFRLHRLSSTEYDGSLTNAAGAVHAEVEGNRLHLRYRIRSPAVTMDQSLWLRADGRAAQNQATVSALSVPIAHLSEEIVRVQ